MKIKVVNEKASLLNTRIAIIVGQVPYKNQPNK